MRQNPASEITQLAMAKAIAEPTGDNIATFGVEAFDDGYAAGILGIADMLAQVIGADNPLVKGMRDAVAEKKRTFMGPISDVIQ